LGRDFQQICDRVEAGAWQAGVRPVQPIGGQRPLSRRLIAQFDCGLEDVMMRQKTIAGLMG
jgi:hypothetical protein